MACQPADPESKGGSEATAKIAKADLVPTEANLMPEYASFGELRAAADAFYEMVNAREHRETRQPPVERLAAERHRLHPLPAEAHTIAFGTSPVCFHADRSSWRRSSETSRWRPSSTWALLRRLTSPFNDLRRSLGSSHRRSPS